MIVVEVELEKVTDTSVLFFRLFIAIGHASTVFFLHFAVNIYT